MEKQLNIVSYNSTGSNQSKLDYINMLLNLSVSFLLVQETWHIESYCDILKSIHNDYLCRPIAGFDASNDIIQGRP